MVLVYNISESAEKSAWYRGVKFYITALEFKAWMEKQWHREEKLEHDNQSKWLWKGRKYGGQKSVAKGTTRRSEVT